MDPLEDRNRSIYAFNENLDEAIIEPAADGYAYIIPNFLQKGLNNFFDNINYPITIINQVLQGNIEKSLQDTLRFSVNTSIGIFGFFDPASSMGLPEHDEDFGQTLDVWGVPHGPYLMLPVLGPSSLRDTVAMIPDAFLSPSILIDHEPTVYSLKFLDLIDTRARYLGLESIVIGDEYLFLKDAYYQNREYESSDGEVEDDFDSFDDY